MAYRNLEIKKGLSDVEKDTGEPRTTIYAWTKSELFTEQFGVFERVTEEGEINNGEIKEKKPKIKKVFPATYDIAKWCVKYFSKFLDLDPHDGEKQKTITGTKIMEYNDAMLKKIDKLKDFEKDLLLSTPSVKYATVMRKYYGRLLDGIAQLSTICIDVNGDYSQESLENILENLKQLTWYHTISKELKHASSDTKQFNINKAFKDVMGRLEEESIKLGDMEFDSELRELKTTEFERKKKEIEAEYYSEIIKKFPKDESVHEFYEKLECDTSCDDGYFKGYRRDFILYSLSDGDAERREMILRNFLNYIDMYGKLLVPGTLEIIDNMLKRYQDLMNRLKSDACIASKLREEFKSVLPNVQYYNNYDKIGECFAFGKEICQLTVKEKAIFTEYHIDEAASSCEMLYKWLNSGNDEDLRKVKENLEMVEIYLRFCAGIIGWSKFENVKKICDKNYAAMCKELEGDKVYKKIKEAIDRFIGQKWRYFIFKK